MTTVNCPVCNVPMIHVGAADHRCQACGYEYVPNWDKMTRIDSALCKASRDSSDSYPGFVPHLIDLCSGAYVPSDDEMADCDALAIAGIADVSPLDVVVWHAWREYLSDLHESFLADEVGIELLEVA